MTRTSISDNGSYPAFCRKASIEPKVFGSFRRNPDYIPILEHVSESLGQEYIKLLDPTILAKADKYLAYDFIGDPHRYEYSIGNFSPTTLRYMKATSDLYRLFGDLSAFRIAEVGCGYGGLCKIISESYQVSEYTLVDLPEVLDLADEFLFQTGVDLDWIDFVPGDAVIKDNFDLFISNYALTECTREVQTKYIERLAATSDRGYITANFINHHFGLDQLSLEEMLEMIDRGAKVLDEAPNTNPDNRVIVWGHE